MECPVCGCGEATDATEATEATAATAATDAGFRLVECRCCGSLWLLAAESLRLYRVLVGPEG